MPYIPPQGVLTYYYARAIRHGQNHRAEGDDPIFDQNLDTTCHVRFASVTIGDLIFKNGWRIVEDPKYGVLLVSPNGKVFRFKVKDLGV